ncbi:hypothetical protein KSX_77450 [Ktedonospora formicarum]|uniref:Uncharacterized protein n=2 Tax=Ktedonospora formicarum TaxID=2778364 RepID=A0A8J3IBF3_9CHLR|nr:hypothetical protein KSX_77450 [Ktedonospora formicarum]
MEIQIDLLFAILVLLLLCFDLFPFQYACLTASIQPIEETEWVELLPRINEWAGRAGVTLASVQVAQDAIGWHGVRIVGLGKRPTLILGEALLRASEWRVRDAFICMALAEHYVGIARRRLRRDIGYLLLLCAWIPCYHFAEQLAHTPMRIGAWAPYIGFPILALVLGLSHPGRAYYKADRFAATLTGDPAALIVAYRLKMAFNGWSISWSIRSLDGKRVEQLAKLSMQPWPRALHASVPVPAIMQISYYTTLPQMVTEPAPVPGELYKIERPA